MSYNVASISAYTDEQRLPLLVLTVFGAKSASILNKMTGVKSIAALNFMETNAQFQTQACGFNASGTTTFTQRNLTVGDIMIHEALCPKTLEAYWMQTQIAPGSPEEIPFEQQYSEKKAALIASQLETAIWQGDTDSANTNLDKFDGLIKLIDAATGVVDATAQASISASTVRGIMQNIYVNIPVAILDKEDTVVLCGFDTLRTYQIALANANLYHYNGENVSGEMLIENTNIKLIAVNGLNSTNRIFASQLSNLFVGTDLEGEEDQFEIFWAKEAREVRFAAEFKMGTQLAFPTQIVSYENS
jgi:hypothetical protein